MVSLCLSRTIKPFSSEFLDRPVDVNRRQTGRVGDVILGEREIAREAIGQAD